MIKLNTENLPLPVKEKDATHLSACHFHARYIRDINLTFWQHASDSLGTPNSALRDHQMSEFFVSNENSLRENIRLK